MQRFRVKYGAGEISRWYSKLDVAVEIVLPERGWLLVAVTHRATISVWSALSQRLSV